MYTPRASFHLPTTWNEEILMYLLMHDQFAGEAQF